MSLYRRSKGGNWWIDVSLPTGERVRKSTNTKDKKEAAELLASLIEGAWRVVNLGDKPKRTWLEAVDRWLKEKGHKKSIEDDKSQLRWLNPFLGGKFLHEISRDEIDFITEKRLEGEVSNSTVNRTLEVLRAMLNMAKDEWGWIDNVPKVRMLPKVEGRVRWLTHGEVVKLINELPAHLVPMVKFSLASGLRQANVKGLKWSQVDIENKRAWIHASESKTKKPIGVPLDSEALEVLQNEYGKHPEYVFTYKGNSIEQVNTKAWRAALKRAGITDFRWHDLRHTWASHHVQAGTPLQVLKELGGWSSIEMVMRYAHLCPDQLADYAERMAQTRLGSGTFTVQEGLN